MAQDSGPATAAVSIIFIVLATVFVAARFYTRAVLVRSIKQDDWWILSAWIIAVAFSAAICVGVKFGLGKHKEDIPDANFASLRKAEYAFSVLYNPALMLTKTSIIVFYLSVMSKDTDPVFKWCNWITLAIVNAAGLALTFLNIFQCRPVAAGYEYPSPADAHCTDIVSLYLSSAPVNIITDLAILILPMPILTAMRLPRKQKIILLVTFGFGIFVAVVDVIRIAFLQNASLSRLRRVTNESGSGTRIVEDNDFSWYASVSFMWSAVEVNIGIICACVPSLKPLFSRFLPSFIRDAAEGGVLKGSFDSAHGKNSSDGSLNLNANELTNPAAFRKASTAEYLGDDDGDTMGFLNMLAGPPETMNSPTSGRSSNRLSRVLSRQSTAVSTRSEFGFVKLDKNKNMLKLNNRQSVWPIAVVTIIFFLWGFAYGLLNTLNSQFQSIDHLSTGQGYGLHAAYFGGYLIGPLTLGRFILNRYGFKAAMMAGLCVYGCGTLVFWPSAVLTSFPAFFVSNFIVGFGLSCLEIAANPYTALCGPLEYAEVRLNLSQAFQAVGTVLSPLLATKVLFKNVLEAPSLVDVQWAYLGIAIFVFALAIVFYYIPLPEATDEQLEEQADRRSAVYNARVGPFPVIWLTLGLGVLAQWCYVGGQEAVGNNAAALMYRFQPNSPITPFDYVTVGHTLFAIGRFVSAFLNYIFKPRWILLALFVGATITNGVQTAVTGDAAAGILMTTYFVEAGLFSIIYATSMRGMGAQTKNAAALMTAAISSGAVGPVAQWGVANIRGLPYSFCIATAFFAVGCIFPIYLNVIPAAKRQVDPVHERDRHTRRTVKRTDSYVSDAAAPTKDFGLMGIIARRKRNKKLQERAAEQRPDEQSEGNVSPTMSPGFGTLEKIVEVPSPAISRGNEKGVMTADFKPWPTGMSSIDDSPTGSRLSQASSSEGSRGPMNETKSQEDTQWTEKGTAQHIDHNQKRKPTKKVDFPDPKGEKAKQEKRAWTEKDDAIDDYHNALKKL